MESINSQPEANEQLVQLPGRLTTVADKFVEKVGGNITVGGYGDINSEKRYSGTFNVSKEDTDTGETEYTIVAECRKRPLSLAQTGIDVEKAVISWNNSSDDTVTMETVSDSFPMIFMKTDPSVAMEYSKSTLSTQDSDPDSRKLLLNRADSVIDALESIINEVDENRRKAVGRDAVKALFKQ